LRIFHVHFAEAINFKNLEHLENILKKLDFKKKEMFEIRVKI